MLLTGGLITMAVLGVLFGIAALQIDDWGRDLSTNHAATRMDAAEPLLRPLDVPAPAAEVRAAIEEFANRDASWQIANLPAELSNDDVMHLVRVSRLFRFADDVHVFLQPTDTGTRIDITSRSRIGKGDLGQNPRNIRALMRALREAFELDQ